MTEATQLAVNTFNLQLGTLPARPFSHLNDPITTAVVQEVLTGKSYPQLPFPFAPRQIIDIGANCGAASLWFRALFPSAHITAYEPFQPNYDLLVHNTRDLDISCIQAAVLNFNGVTPLYNSHFGPCGYSTLPSNEHCSAQSTAVPAVSIRQAVRPETDILKIDIEGHERLLIDILTTWHQLPPIIYLEYHSESTRREIDRLLEASHTLILANANYAHLGNLCYAATNLTQGIPQ